MEKTLLNVEHLKIQFDEEHVVVQELSFEVHKGEIIGLVGESGSGKSMTAMAILGLLKEGASVVEGNIHYEGANLLHLSEGELCKLRGKEIAVVFQEPMTSLNPVLRIGAQMNEMIQLHEKVSKEACKERSLQALKEAGFEDPDTVYASYPHQLSGGMRQRIMIAMAMLHRPKLLIADEPTTALDVTTQAKILKTIQTLNETYGTAIILVSHDLGVIRQVCDRAVVMCDGVQIEQGTVEDLFDRPKESYTKHLIQSIPKPNWDISQQKESKEKQEIAMDKSRVLEVKQLEVSYKLQQGIRSSIHKMNREQVVLHDINFQLKKGEILGIVGASGGGKTTLVKTIQGIVKPKAGEICTYNNKIQMVFQDPYSSLNPTKKVGWLIEEPLRLHTSLSKVERKNTVIHMLEQVGLSKEYMDRKPASLSGGQRQRIAIAMALITKPEIVILDEPVSALDVTVQAQILDLLVTLRDEYHLSYLFISHDLNVVSQICNRAIVMRQGCIVEEGTIEQLFLAPKHEYTKELLQHHSFV